MADQVPVYDPDGNIIGYASTKETSEGLHVQRVLPSDEAGTTLALATSAKQDTAKEVLDAILTALGGTLTVDGSGATQPVSAAALPLPTGAATAAKQDSAKAVLDAILAALAAVPVTAAALPLPAGAATEATLAGTLTVDGSGVTQPVSAAALPLPTGASTAANQITALSRLPAALTAGGNLKVSVEEGKVPTGTAGTPDAAVVSVQGIASMTPVKTTICRADGTVVDPSAAPGDCFADAHEPAVNTKATIVIAAPGAGRRLVATGLTATIAADAAPAAVKVSVQLIEDAGGTPTVRWRSVLGLQAVAGASAGVTRPCWIPTVAANKSLTLEFSAAGGANTYQAVALEGYTIAE
jgi:hypothetical protein